MVEGARVRDERLYVDVVGDLLPTERKAFENDCKDPRRNSEENNLQQAKLKNILSISSISDNLSTICGRFRLGSSIQSKSHNIEL